MQPGAALVCDNWLPTMRGLRLRAGYVRWVDLHRPPLMEPLTDEAGEDLTDEAGEVLLGRVDGLEATTHRLERKPPSPVSSMSRVGPSASSSPTRRRCSM